MLSTPVTIESLLRAFGDFTSFFNSLVLYDTATGRIVDSTDRERICNSLLDTGTPMPVLFALPGLGDSILLTAVARHQHAVTERKVWVCSRHAPVYYGSRDISHVLLNYDMLHEVPQFTDFLLQLDLAPVFVAYGRRKIVNGRRAVVSPDCHMITHMCRMAGLRGEVLLRPYVEEMPASAPFFLSGKREYIIFQSDGRPWKHWGTDKFQLLANDLKERFLIVQTGLASDEPGLENAVDLRGRLDLPALAGAMRGARLFVGNEGGLAHLARAVDTKAVLAMSCNYDPAVLGYIANKNIRADQPCELCTTGVIKIYKGEPCPKKFQCVNISVAAMREGIEEALDDPSMPVARQTVAYPPAVYDPRARSVFEQWFAE